MLKSEIKELINEKSLAGKDCHGTYANDLDFSTLDLSNTDLRGCVLSNSNFTGCKFKDTDLRGAVLYKATGITPKTKGIIVDSSTQWDDVSAVVNGADVSIPIVVGDIKTVSMDVWASEWRPHSPSGTEPICFGGSDMGKLANKSPFGNRRGLIQVKRGELPVEHKDTVSLRAGHRCEPIVAESFVDYMLSNGYAKTCELIEDTNMYQHPLHRWMLCDMDYLVRIDGKLCILECKTCSLAREEEIANFKKGILNEEYTYQILQYLSIGKLMGIDTVYVCDMWGVQPTVDGMAVIRRTLNDTFEYDGKHTLDDIREQMLSYVDKIYIKLLQGEDIKDSKEEEGTDELFQTYVKSGVMDKNAKKRAFVELPEDVEMVLARMKRTEDLISEKKKEISELETSKAEMIKPLFPLFGDCLSGYLKTDDGMYWVNRNIEGRDYIVPLDKINEVNATIVEDYMETTIPVVYVKDLIKSVKDGSATIDELEDALTMNERVSFNERKFKADYIKEGYFTGQFAGLGKCPKGLAKNPSITAEFKTFKEMDKKNKDEARKAKKALETMPAK